MSPLSHCVRLVQLAVLGVLLSPVSFPIVNVPLLSREIHLPSDLSSRQGDLAPAFHEVRASRTYAGISWERVTRGAARLQATVTAYSSSPDETWGDPFVTASGRRVFEGLVACPRALPFGTKVRIGGRTYECYDRLHPKYDNRFDIWMATKNAALAFGKRQLRVELIKG